MILHPETLERAVRMRGSWFVVWVLPAAIAVGLVLAFVMLTP